MSLWHRVRPLQSPHTQNLPRPQKEVQKLVNTLQRPGLNQKALKVLVESSGFDAQEMNAALDGVLGSLGDVQLYTLHRKLTTAYMRDLAAALQKTVAPSPWTQGQLEKIGDQLLQVNQKIQEHLQKRDYVVKIPKPKVISKTRGLQQTASICELLQGQGAFCEGTASEEMCQSFAKSLLGGAEEKERFFENIKSIKPELKEQRIQARLEALRARGVFVAPDDIPLAKRCEPLISTSTVDALYKAFEDNSPGLTFPPARLLRGRFEKSRVGESLRLEPTSGGARLTVRGEWRLGDHFGPHRTPLDEKKSALSLVARIQISDTGVQVEDIRYQANLCRGEL